MTLKLGPFAMGQSAATQAEVIEWLKLRPTVAKFYAWGHRDKNNPVPGNEDFYIINFAAPETLCVIRPMENYTLWQGAPEDEARKYFDFAFAGLLQRYKRQNLILEATNETGISASEPDKMRWHSRFMAEVARITYQESGGLVRAGIGAWSTGNPSGTSTDPLCQWEQWREALDAIEMGCAVLTLHEYGTLPAPRDTWNLLRYRRVMDRLRRMGYTRTKIIITEFAYDSNPEFGTYNRWRDVWGTDLQSHYNEFVKFYADEISKDNYLLGATWYTIGNGGSGAWDRFNLAGFGVVDILKKYIGETGLYRVKVGAGWQRTGPGTQYPIALWGTILIYLTQGQLFRCVETQNGWGKNASGRWMKLSLLEKL